MLFSIGLDLMGGDNPPECLFPAVIKAAKCLSPQQSLQIFASKHINKQLSSIVQASLTSKTAARISFKECTDTITMADSPLLAVRRKKKSSLVMGMKCLKEKEIQAFVSCGNTGALIACAAIYLPLLPDVSHPALLAFIPTDKGTMVLLDAGGNIQAKAEQLVRFAFLGAGYQRVLGGISKPAVGLLNVGVESHKGTLQVRQAYEILKQHCGHAEAGMHFVGNVEGRDIFKGTVDVLVTDGFTGNILLKTAEGTASFILDTLQKNAERNIYEPLKKQFNYAEYPGAIVCGIDGIVIKVHGNATSESLLASILRAIECVEKEITFKV